MGDVGRGEKGEKERGRERERNERVCGYASGLRIAPLLSALFVGPPFQT
jgi:hypothetical protein